MFKHGFGRILNIVLIVGTLIGILEPAFSQNIGLTQIILSLFEPHWNQQFLMRWLLALSFAASCYALAVSLIFRNIPITIIWTDLRVKFMNAEGTRVEINRQQLLRANQPNVTAYFSSHTPSSGGSVPHGLISGTVYCESCNLNDRIEVTGPEEGKSESMHIFGTALPYAWYMPLIPAWVLNREHRRLPKFLRKYVVLRNFTIVYLNEYNGPEPIMQFATTSGPYHHFNMEIEIDFAQKAIPDSLRVMRIQNNGVTEVNFQRNPNNVVNMRIDRMRTETLRITWVQLPATPTVA